MFSRIRSGLKSFFISERSDDYVYYYPHEFSMYYMPPWVKEEPSHMEAVEEPSYTQPFPTKP